MAKLKDIKGSAIQYLAEDPVEYVGSWSSGGSLNTVRRALSGAGIQTAALGAGGGEPSKTNTELYDGSSWTEVNDLSTARRLLAGLGLQTAALAIGGFNPPGAISSTEEWDGTNWTAGGSLNTARYGLAAAGIQTAGIAFGGDGPNVLNESYNGTSWTEVGDLNTGGLYLGGFGLQTAAIALKSATVESWNGTSWTEVNDLNTGRSQMGCSGIQTAGLAFGGNGPSALTESWDGTSWTEVNDLGTARAFLAGSTNAPNTTSLAFGGTTGSESGATEEWSFPTPPVSNLQEGQLWFNYTSSALKGYGTAAGIPAATFASGANLNTARGYQGGAGTDHEALLAFGGTTGSATAITEQYNGSSWTEVSDLNTARSNVTGFGSSIAAIAGNGSTPTKVETESWNGSSWTEIAETNFSRSDSTGAGTQTSGMIATGTPVPGNPSFQPGGSSTVTETWNGTSWTEVGDTNTKRLQAGMAGSGTTSAGIIAAGEDGPGSRTLNAETWDGTSWTEVNNLSNQRGTLYNFMGNSSLANAAGGYNGTARIANNEHWNGTSWTEINDLSTARNAAYGAGSAVNGAVFGGNIPPYTSATEEFIASNSVSTVTTS